KNPRRVTLEAALLRNVNTSRKHADLLAEFARGLDAAVNVIPWNPVAGLRFEGVPLRAPDKAEVERFIAALRRRGMNVTARLKKGGDIAGACGQLG
ncbi:MAG: 23S rRNA (adenine(2503)-C2)-methyltransferase, partial [Treponema sp.]|nr:23S rRNA (adenine(2503)-C2)-methyltransferase [Treponema sp.]